MTPTHVKCGGYASAWSKCTYEADKFERGKWQKPSDAKLEVSGSVVCMYVCIGLLVSAVCGCISMLYMLVELSLYGESGRYILHNQLHNHFS